MVIQGLKQVTRKREASLMAAKYILDAIDPVFSEREREKQITESESIKYMSEADLEKAIEEAENRAQQVKEGASNE